jgi:hypothetical protein
VPLIHFTTRKGQTANSHTPDFSPNLREPPTHAWAIEFWPRPTPQSKCERKNQTTDGRRELTKQSQLTNILQAQLLYLLRRPSFLLSFKALPCAFCPGSVRVFYRLAAGAGIPCCWPSELACLSIPKTLS